MLQTEQYDVVILAGGECKRLYPLTSLAGGGTVKALLPVGNRPLISYPLRHLAEAGIKSAIVVSIVGSPAQKGGRSGWAAAVPRRLSAPRSRAARGARSRWGPYARPAAASRRARLLLAWQVAVGEAVASRISSYLQQQAAAGGVACKVRGLRGAAPRDGDGMRAGRRRQRCSPPAPQPAVHHSTAARAQQQRGGRRPSPGNHPCMARALRCRQVVTVSDDTDSGDALRAAVPHLAPGARGAVVYAADLVCDAPLGALVLSHALSGALATLLVGRRRVSPTTETKPGKAPKARGAGAMRMHLGGVRSVVWQRRAAAEAAGHAGRPGQARALPPLCRGVGYPALDT